MIVDVHTHWGDCFQKRDGSNPSKWLEVLDRHGVTHAVVLPFAGLLADEKIVQDNNDVAAACAASNGRMLPLCTARTWYEEHSLPEIERCLGKLGFRGVKFHPWTQGIGVNSPVMDKVCEMAAHYDVPILFHDGTPCFSMPAQMALLARRHPKTRIILGHMGLFEHWREAIHALRVAPNLWGCICSPHPGAIREFFKRCDLGRLTWGSDFGFNFNDAVGYRLEMLEVVGITDTQREAVLATNPRRLMRMTG